MIEVTCSGVRGKWEGSWTKNVGGGVEEDEVDAVGETEDDRFLVGHA
jgi:hypothetical protein